MNKFLTPTTEQKAARNSENVSRSIYGADYFQYSQGLMTESVSQAKPRTMGVNLKRCEYTEAYPVSSELVEKNFRGF